MVELLTGLRRVSWIRVRRGVGGLRAEAVGMGHRLPAVVPISVGTATRLAAGGVPVVVHDEGVGDGADGQAAHAPVDAGTGRG
jgi:hypothetical protein